MPPKSNDPARLSLFDRPLASGKAPEKFTLYTYLTFKNIVAALGAVTLLIFVGATASAATALVTACLIGLFALVLVEMSARRRWERDMVGQLQRMTADYERLVRDVARNRNDTSLLRKRLSDAAASVARTYDKSPGESADQRMIRSLVDQIARIADMPESSGEKSAPAPEEPSVTPEPAPDTETLSTLPSQPEQLTEAQVLHLVRTAARQDNVDLFLQPIVGLPQRKVRFYETFSRIRVSPGAYLPAARYVEVAHKQDLMPVIDNLLLLRGLQILRNAEDTPYNRAFFFNITSVTLNDPKFMGDLVEFISQNRLLAPRLIFELAQADLVTMNADILPILDGLSKLGCRFSMDQVRSLVLDYSHLDTLHIRFIKVDADMLMQEMKDDAGLQRLKRFKAELDRNGIDLIVGRIETDRQLLEMLEIDVDYGQGYLFGKPAPYEKAA